MISIDWKERFENDIAYFCNSRIPEKDFDIDIMCNIYPIREKNRIPHEVLEFIGKNMGRRLAKKDTDYSNFFDYLWEKKHYNGRTMLVYIFMIFIKKDESFYSRVVQNYLKKSKGELLQLLIKKIVAPILSKDVMGAIDDIVILIQKDDLEINKSLLTILNSGFKKDHMLIDLFFEKTLSEINSEDEIRVKFFSEIFKRVYKVDKEKYLELFVDFSKSKEANIICVLSRSIYCKDKKIDLEIASWGESGNSKIVKSFERVSKK